LGKAEKFSILDFIKIHAAQFYLFRIFFAAMDKERVFGHMAKITICHDAGDAENAEKTEDNCEIKRI